MKAEIEAIGRIFNLVEVQLYEEIIKLGNYDYICDCNHSVQCNFINTIPHIKNHVFCLNCGGYISK